MKSIYRHITNNGFAHFTFLGFVLSGLCASVVQTPAQEFKTVYDGVEYAEVNHKIGSDRVKINLLRLDLTKVRLDVHHAMDAAIGTEKTSSIATRHGAFAAINAGFFRLDTSIFAGDAAGVLQVDGKLLSESSNNRVGLMIKNDAEATEVAVGHLDLKYKLTLYDGRRRDFVPRNSIEISGINRERKDDEIVLFTPEFGRTTLTNPSGVELIFEKGTKKHLEKVSLGNSPGSNLIPSNGYILSASASRKTELLDLLNPTYARNLSIPVSVVDVTGKPQEAYLTTLFKVEDITNGVPQLIKDGKIDITWEQEKASKSFVETRHPRTAVAKLKDGKFLMITVDGRQPGVSVGMNLNELAEYLLELGVVDAMNFDGGGSTTMFLDGKVVNQPSDKEGERKVSDAILVTLRKKR